MYECKTLSAQSVDYIYLNARPSAVALYKLDWWPIASVKLRIYLDVFAFPHRHQPTEDTASV